MADGAPGLRGPLGAAAAASAAPSLRPGGWPARPSLPSFPSRRWGGGLRGLTGASEAGVAPGREPAAAVGPGAGCVCGGRLPKAEPGAGLPEGGRGKGLRASGGARELGRRPAPLLGAEDGACGGGGWGAGTPSSSVERKSKKDPPGVSSTVLAAGTGSTNVSLLSAWVHIARVLGVW